MGSARKLKEIIDEIEGLQAAANYVNSGINLFYKQFNLAAHEKPNPRKHFDQVVEMAKKNPEVFLSGIDRLEKTHDETCKQIEKLRAKIKTDSELTPGQKEKLNIELNIILSSAQARITASTSDRAKEVCTFIKSTCAQAGMTLDQTRRGSLSDSEKENKEKVQMSKAEKKAFRKERGKGLTEDDLGKMRDEEILKFKR